MSRKNRKLPRYMLEEERGTVLPVNHAALSPKSRRSWAIDFLHVTYTDTGYRCCGCGITCIYTAAQQKHDCEVKKFYFWTRRTRCQRCHVEWGDLRAEIRQYPERLRAGVTADEAAQMQAAMDRYRVLNGGTFDRALYDRIAKFRTAIPNACD